MNSSTVTKLLWIVPLLLLTQAADTATRENAQPQLSTRTHLNPAQLQQECSLGLAQELNQDINVVNRGLLPKDMVSKLKRVENLAKRLSKEIAP
jgi:hypothetical protein